MNAPARAPLPPGLDQDDLDKIHEAHKVISTGMAKAGVTPVLATFAMIDSIHAHASHKKCPPEYRQLVPGLLRQLAADIDAIEADAPKIVTS